MLQISGPGHIPWSDPRWQELLVSYDVWVHLEQSRVQGDIVSTACRLMSKHAAQSSNLAALARHVAHMIREWTNTITINTTATSTPSASQHIAGIGKARAMAGTMHLMRLLVHDVDPIAFQDALTYTSRDMGEKEKIYYAGVELVDVLLNFITIMGLQIQPWEKIPEVYDATVNALELILVLLSTPLYQPMISSTQRKQQKLFSSSSSTNENHHCHPPNYIMEYIMKQAQQLRSNHQQSQQQSWTPQSILHSCLQWQTHRPRAPPRSIAHHMIQLAESVVDAKGSRKGPDDMYETHLLVLAERPQFTNKTTTRTRTLTTTTTIVRRRPSSVLLDATRGVLVLSSTIFLLPFRLMNLALGLLGRRRGTYDTTRKEHLIRPGGRTNDVLWLTKSPVADMASALVLLLIHNYRVKDKDTVGNPFRAELASLNDNRWDTEPETYTPNGYSRTTEATALLQQEILPSRQLLTTNFESLFHSFGLIVHTEVGSLLFYSIFQSSPIFAASVAVRSDLDTLIVPMLRTLYFSSTLNLYSGGVRMNGGTSSISIRSCPFRSSSQLYVILILLLLFSQDASFGPDAFRRVMIPAVPWYKERTLKNVSLGSLLLLTILRSITFNLNRLHDTFLLSNCCAVLMNLSPNVVHLHDYAAMRLASMTASCLKKYAAMVTKHGGKESEDDIASPLGMYGEVSRTLLRLVQHCTSPKNIDKNCHLVYALVYHQADFRALFENVDSPFGKSEMMQLAKVIEMADKLIQDNGEARTAPRALKVLRESMDILKESAKDGREKECSDFTFSYEEEADPEIFFVPYVWEVIVCVITSSTIDWDKNRIQIFPLLDEEPLPGILNDDVAPVIPPFGFVEDVDDVV